MAPWLFLSILLAQGLIPRADTGVITGIVRQQDGAGAAGVRVAAMVPPEAGLNARNTSELAAIGKTDDSGAYRLEDVPAGRYYVVAGRVDAPTYYPGTSSPEGATVLSVSPGSTLDNIDFVISPESARAPDPRDSLQQFFSGLANFGVAGPPVQAPGRVVMDPNSPDKKLPTWVTLNVQGNSPRLSLGGRRVLIAGGSSAIKSSVAPDGSFSISLQSGEATISVHGLPEGYTVKSMRSGPTDLLSGPLKVEAGMAEIVLVLTADLRPRYTMEGRVLGGAANRTLMGEQIELLGDAGLIARIILDPEGQFIFRKLLPGTYRLRLSSSDRNTSEQRVTVTDRNVTAIEFRLEPLPR